MFGKKLSIFCLFALVSLNACAQPKYESAANPGTVGQGSEGRDVSACAARFAKAGYCVTWKWETMPTDEKAGSLLFQVSRANPAGGPALAVDLPVLPTLSLWMPAMGHGSSPTTVTHIGAGTYRATNVFFVMPGDWELRFQVKDGATVRDEAVVAITI